MNKEWPPSRITIAWNTRFGGSVINENHAARYAERRGDTIETYLSLAESDALAREHLNRITRLEQRIQFILDDPECELYRNQAAEEIGYKGSFPGKKPSRETEGEE